MIAAVINMHARRLRRAPVPRRFPALTPLNGGTQALASNEAKFAGLLFRDGSQPNSLVFCRTNNYIHWSKVPTHNQWLVSNIVVSHIGDRTLGGGWNRSFLGDERISRIL